jgi:small neutral amino acid transporter SnatA (MarC family)
VRGPDIPRGGGYGTINEALTGLWLTARADPRLADVEQPIGERAQCIAGLAISAQSDQADAERFPRPDRVRGAWFRDGETRMDDQQHALAALLRTQAIVRAGGGSDGADDETPAAWLWALILLLALDPVRAAFGVPRSPATARSDAINTVLLGGAAGALLVLAASAVAPPLLDALDVSDPSFRTAAGIVAVVAGVADLFRRSPRPEPALPGRRAALVPVAVPLVARPALLVLALGAGADRGILPSTVAMAIGMAALAALVAVEAAAGHRARRLRWIARLLAAGLIAGGIMLIIHGVFDV